jgi:septal ring factor EnvC (AmiA/AmiB activator)
MASKDNLTNNNKNQDEIDNQVLNSIYSEMNQVNTSVARLDERMDNIEADINHIERDIESLDDETTTNTHRIAVGAVIASLGMTWILDNVALSIPV